ncbi:hypothetical protein EPO15_12790 [bacterium]|nr:MAG: hypothetical protein EPO15_12790 [bacterium]
MKRAIPILKRAAASVICAALLVATPGVGAWEAVAQVVPIHLNAPIGGMNGVGAAGAGVRTAPVTTPGLGSIALPIMGMPGLAPTAMPDVRGAAPVGLPASVLPGASPVSADTFSRFAQPGAVTPEGRWTPPPGPGGAQSILPAAAAAPSLSNVNQDLEPSALKTEADGLPGEISNSLQTVHGQTNSLGRHFSALRAAFGLKGDADFAPVNAVKGSLKPGADATAPTRGGFLSTFKPLSAARTGLARLIGVGRSSSAPQAPPQPLTLKTSADGMSLSIEAASAKNAVSTEDAPAPTPVLPSKTTPEKPAGWFGLGKMAFLFIGSLVVAQIGVEALGAAMPTLVQKTFGDFTAVAQLAVFSSIASVVGRQLGPVAVRKFGLKTSYLGASALRLVSISILAGLLATGHMTLPLMMGFYSINGLLGGISGTAMESIPPAIVGQDQARIEKFWTWEQTILEIIGIAGPIATGAIVASFGFLPALVAFPVTMAISLAIVALTLRMPKGLDAADAAQKSATAAAPKKGFFEKIFHGAKLVWGNPLLRTSFLAYTVYTMLNPFLYTMLGPAYGIALLGAANAQAATSVIGWLTGLYSLGGLLGGFSMMWEQKRMKAADAANRAKYEAEKGKTTDEQWEEISKPWQTALLRKSMLKWMLLGTFGLAGVAAMAIPMPMLGALVSLPAWLGWAGTLTLPALTLVPFGAAQVVAMLKLRSFFQASVPDAKENMPDAMGFFGSASLVVTTAGLMSLKYLFKAFVGFTPFFYIAAAMAPLAAYYLYLRWRLSKQSAPK